MKKSIALGLFLILPLLSLTACGGSGGKVDQQELSQALSKSIKAEGRTLTKKQSNCAAKVLAASDLSKVTLKNFIEDPTLFDGSTTLPPKDLKVVESKEFSNNLAPCILSKTELKEYNKVVKAE